MPVYPTIEILKKHARMYDDGGYYDWREENICLLLNTDYSVKKELHGYTVLLWFMHDGLYEQKVVRVAKKINGSQYWNSYNLVDKRYGNFILKEDVEDINEFFCGNYYLSYRQNAKYGWLNPLGNVIIAPVYDEVKGLMDYDAIAGIGYREVRKGNCYGLLTDELDCWVPCIYKEVKVAGSEHLHPFEEYNIHWPGQLLFVNIQHFYNKWCVLIRSKPMLQPTIRSGFIFDSLDEFNPDDFDIEDVPEITGIINGKTAALDCKTGKVKLHI